MVFGKLLAGDGLKARSIRSMGFSILSFGGGSGLRLIGNLILTRILFPEAFGMMALIQIVIAGLTMFSDLGIHSAIIKDERGNDPDYLNTAWVMQICRGVCLWLITCLLAHPVANFYNIPELAQILPIAGLTAIIQGFNSTKLATENKALRLGRTTAIAVSAQFGGLVVTVALALWFQNIWALVFGGLATPLLMLIASHIVLPGHNNRLQFDTTIARSILSFGAFIFIASAATFISLNVDRAILGKYVSLEELALYNIGFFLATVPVQLLKRLVERVIFPLYTARPPKDSPENLHKLGQSRMAVILLALGITAFLALVGTPLIALLYDARYHAAGPLLTLIALAHMPELITTHYALAIMGAGNSRGFAVFLGCVALFKTTLIFLGAVYFGVVGVAIAPAIAICLLYPIAIWLIRPYGAWIPKHDLGLICLIIVVSSGIIWINWPYIGPLIETAFAEL